MKNWKTIKIILAIIIIATALFFLAVGLTVYFVFIYGMQSSALFG